MYSLAIALLEWRRFYKVATRHVNGPIGVAQLSSQGCLNVYSIPGSLVDAYGCIVLFRPCSTTPALLLHEL